MSIPVEVLRYIDERTKPTKAKDSGLIADPAFKKLWCPDCMEWHPNKHFTGAKQKVCYGCNGNDDEDIVFPGSWPSCPNCGEEGDDYP